MARTIGEVSVAVELWEPAVQQRFEAIFAVASRKSLSTWRIAARNAADVLILDGSVPNLSKEGSDAPCAVYVGGDAALQPLGRSSKGWAAHLDVDFTMSDLIDMLDRAAVFLMDWKVRQTATVVMTVQKAIADLQQQGFDCLHRFQLKSWVSLPGSANTAQNMRVLALLSRGPIEARALSEHAGVDLPQLLSLMALPQVQSALRFSAQSTKAPPPQSSTKSQPAASAPRQWVQKLTGWITRGGRT